MTAKVAFAVMLLTAVVAAMLFAGCGGEMGDESAERATVGPTVTAQSATQTPTPVATTAATMTARATGETPDLAATTVAQAIATAMAQAATVQAAYATPVPETGYCGRLCQDSFWQNASIADLDDEISKGVAVNAKGGYPLRRAVVDADVSVIEALLDRGVDIAAVNDSGETALHIVSKLPDARPGVVGLLLERGANANAQTTVAAIPTVTPCPSCEMHIAGGHAPLHFTNDTLVAALLLNYGADVNLKNAHSQTPLFGAVSSGQSGMVALLLEHGADANTANQFGWPVLFEAASSGQSDTVALLLEHGADVNVVTENGTTSLLVASVPGNANTIATLVEHGADVDAANEDGYTPLYAAINSGNADAVALLLAHGADTGYAGITACQFATDERFGRMAEQSEMDAIKELVCP